jgi:dephospho-CoA kinase
MKTIGLTGGIGSGKSVVARLFETMNIPVYDSDREAKKITSGSGFVRTCLIEHFGQEIYPKGVLNKKLLASLIFGNEKSLKFVNSIIHPEVQKDFIRWKEQWEDRSLVVIESAILFESGFDRGVDVSITVSAPLEIRTERVQKRDETPREAIFDRMRNQMTEEERNRKSGYVIINDNYQAILPQVENILEKLNFKFL